jgi:hypothetical protein
MIRRRAVRRRIRHERPGRPGAPPHHLPRLGRGQERLAQQDRTPRHDGRLGRGQVGHDPTGAGDGHLPGALLWLLCVSRLLCFSGSCVSRAAVCRCAVLLCDGAQLMEDHDKDGDGHLSLEVTPCARSCFRFPKSPRQVSIVGEPISQVYHRSSRYFGERRTPYASRRLYAASLNHLLDGLVSVTNVSPQHRSSHVFSHGVSHASLGLRRPQSHAAKHAGSARTRAAAFGQRACANVSERAAASGAC